MNRLKWWFRIVGAFYLLLALVNIPGFFDNQLFASSLPFPAGENAARAFADGWSAFVFDMLGIGTFLLWASRDPLKHLSVVWFAVWLEVLHGIVADVYLIVGGYNAVAYAVFIGIHLIIIITGVLCARQTTAQSPQATQLATKQGIL
jgi:hypothetical protein